MTEHSLAGYRLCSAKNSMCAAPPATTPAVSHNPRGLRRIVCAPPLARADVAAVERTGAGPQPRFAAARARTKARRQTYLKRSQRVRWGVWRRLRARSWSRFAMGRPRNSKKRRFAVLRGGNRSYVRKTWSAAFFLCFFGPTSPVLPVTLPALRAGSWESWELRRPPRLLGPQLSSRCVFWVESLWVESLGKKERNAQEI